MGCFHSREQAPNAGNAPDPTAEKQRRANVGNAHSGGGGGGVVTPATPTAAAAASPFAAVDANNGSTANAAAATSPARSASRSADGVGDAAAATTSPRPPHALDSCRTAGTSVSGRSASASSRSVRFSDVGDGTGGAAGAEASNDGGGDAGHASTSSSGGSHGGVAAVAGAAAAGTTTTTTTAATATASSGGISASAYAAGAARAQRSRSSGSGAAAKRPPSARQASFSGVSQLPISTGGDISRAPSFSGAGAAELEVLRSQRADKLRARRGGLATSFASLQSSLETRAPPVRLVCTRAAGLKHIGFGPFKRENQDEFFIQVGDFGGVPGANLFCVFDGHGSHGKHAAAASRQVLPVLLDAEMRTYFERVSKPEDGLKGAVEVLLSEAFGETERSLQKAGVNLASSGTTASVAYQHGNAVWVASAGDSRVVLVSRSGADGAWRPQPLTIDHRPRRASERVRVEAAGGRVAPKRLPSGRTVGEPRLWLQELPSPGLLLSRSLGDLMAASVGCTSDPEVTYVTVRPGIDGYLIMASDGVWDVLSNEQVADIVVESPDPHIACRRVLDASLYEWEERMSADNITVLVVEFDWDATAAGQAASAAAVAVAGGGGGGGGAGGNGSAAAAPPAGDVPAPAAAAPAQQQQQEGGGGGA